MKKITNIFLIILSLVLFQNCDDEQFESSIDIVSFAGSSHSTGVDIGGSATYDINVYSSSKASSDLTFNIAVDATGAGEGSYDVPSTVTIPSGSNEGSFTVNLSDSNLGIGVNALILSFTDVRAGFDHGESTTIEYTQNCEEVIASLDIIFDEYASETSYEITDALGGVVSSADLGTWSDGDASASVTISLCSGRDYTFTINDDFEDGLSYPINGTYTLTIGGEIKVSGGGNFGASESTEFDTN